MNEEDHECVVNELESLICETRETLKASETTGMDEQLPSDYQQLQDIYTRAVNDQRAHTVAMLEQGRVERPV